MSKSINIVKLCVGIASVAELEAWQARQQAGGAVRHVTRMFPKRTEEVLGGSLYWVFKGQILARQRILDLEEVTGADGIKRCAFVLDPELIRTQATPRRAFQGWRYLEVADSPADMPKARADDDTLPPALEAALAEIGLR